MSDPLVPKRGDQFYLGYPSVLWCHCTGLAQKHISFEVINGRWSGKLDLESLTVTHKFGSYQGSEVVWVGKAPFQEDQYNEAIAWIEEQLPDDKKWTRRPWLIGAI